MAIIHDDQPPTKRKRCIPKHLSDSVITAPLPQFHACEDSKNLKSLANEILDCLEEEFTERFSEENTGIWISLKALLPSNEEHFLDPERLQPLIDYLFTVPFVAEHWQYYNNRTIKTRVSSEYQIFRQLLSNHIQDLRKAKVEGDTIMLMIKYLKGHGDSVYLILRTLLKFAIIIGFSNGSTENCFSARNRIDSEYRRRLGKEFQGLMTVLHFEKKLNSAVTFAEFLKVWKVIKKTAP